jgi:bacterioferritin-associated ferredoxin
VFPDPGAALAWAHGNTILCRCEGVCVGEVRAAIAEGAATVANLRTWTRAGMGYCQGRICGANARALLSQATGVSEGALGLQPARFPVRPAPLDAVLDWSSDDG